MGYLLLKEMLKRNLKYRLDRSIYLRPAPSTVRILHLQN